MLRCVVFIAVCAILHVVGVEGLGLEGKVPFDQHRIQAISWYLKWGITWWTVTEINAVLNRWAENRWIWKQDMSAWDWENEVAVVTGGSNGIGACVAKLLASHGIKVAVLDVSSFSDAFTPDERKLIRHYRCDITSRDAISSAAQAIRSDLGSPSILINNAGIGNASTILEVPLERMRKLFEINLISHWSTVQEFLPDMLKRKKGHVMSVASLSSFVTIAAAVDYSCSKSALLSFHEGLTTELKYRYKCPEIKTTTVHPNWTKSALTSHPAMKAGMKKLRRKMLEAEDVAEAMVKQILAGRSGRLILGPKLSPRVRALPVWLQELIRDSQAFVVDGNGTTAVE